MNLSLTVLKNISIKPHNYLYTKWYKLQYYISTNLYNWYNIFFIKLTNFYFYQQYWKKLILQIFGEGFFYIRGLIIIFFIDGCLTDDEPLWEPLEWSLVQT